LLDCMTHIIVVFVALLMMLILVCFSILFVFLRKEVPEF
jgi:hypothetical protein